jgi:flagellin
MTFGLGRVQYQEMYIHGATDYSDWATETGLAASTLTTTTVMKGSSYDVVAAATQASENAFNGEADITNIDAIGDDFIGAVSTVTTDVDAAATLTVRKTVDQLRYSASEGMYTADGNGNPQTNLLTTVVQNVQAKINTARVQAGSQYAALESAVNYTTDLTAQYELGYNTVNDVNFSMETAHLAKNQILQQAATAMLAQANQGQQGLLQLIS